MLDGARYITNAVIERIKEGVIPWRKAWKPGYHGAVSYATGRQYEPFNQWLLRHEGEYIGVKAAKKANADFRGVKTEFVVWGSWKQLPVTDKNGDPVYNEDGSPKTVTRYFYSQHPVLPVALLSGVTPKWGPKDGVDNGWKPVVPLDEIAADAALRMNIEVMHDNCSEPKALAGTVIIPEISRFDSPEAYYMKLFSLLALARALREEEKFAEGTSVSKNVNLELRKNLIAEITGVMVCSALDLVTDDTLDNSVGYMQKLIADLQSDAYAIVWSAPRAERLAEMILNINNDSAEEQSAAA